MLIKDIMTAGVDVIGPADTIIDAAKKMKELDAGVLPVCDGDRIKGILTDRDIVVRGLAGDLDFQDLKVQDVMTPHVHFIYEDQDAGEAAELMEKEEIRRLIVLNRDKKLVGILSLGDLAIEGTDEKVSGHVLKKVSEAAPSPLQH